ncbi:hypothetical protein AVEN_60581-1, partial [Araneus ventricosus]
MVGPLPGLVSYRACVGPAEAPDATVSLCTWFGSGCSRFVDPSASGQHQTSNQHNAGPCCGNVLQQG